MTAFWGAQRAGFLVARQAGVAGVAILVASVVVLVTTPAWGQSGDAATVVVPVDGSGGPMVVTPDGVVAAPGGPGGPPNADGENADAGDAEKPAKTPEDDSPPVKVIRRGEVSPPDADPGELDVRVEDDGMIEFQFRSQRWPELIQWLAEISGRPIDWLELPADDVNLQSPGRYTVEQTRDLFNRHLLARGFTLLDADAGDSVVATATINPAVVPRVDVDSLDSMPAFRFVRTTMDAGWLSAEKLVEEMKPMLSPGGRLTALATTNKIEAMDAAINLRQVAKILRSEAGADSRLSLAPEMRLRHISATTAKGLLEEFLGIAKKEPAPMSPQQMQQMQQMGGNPGAMPTGPKKPDISVVANVRQNSVLVRAPADRVAIAMEFLKRLDVPSVDVVSLADIEQRVQVFRLAQLDPEKLIEIVTDMNILEPGTRVRTDKENQAVVVSGSAADRFIIATLVERLDGSGRTFEVMPLRRLDPVEVAESIQFLMGKKKDEKEDSSRRSYYSYFSRRNSEPEKPKDEFRVAANTRQKQILLWANDQELRQIESLLIKLGELPPPGGNPQRVRVIEAAASGETMAYLRAIKRQFSEMADNEILLPKLDIAPERRPAAVNGRSPAAEASPAGESEAPAAVVVPRDDVEARLIRPRGGGAIRLVQTPASPPQTTTPQTNPQQTTPRQQPPIRSAADFDRVYGVIGAIGGAAQDAVEAPGQVQDANRDSTQNSRRAPIEVTFDRDGNLLLRSDDTRALDRLEAMMIRQTPPTKPYRVFEIRHATAKWMKGNLELYFKEQDADSDSEADNFYSWYWGIGDDQKEDSPSGLGGGVNLRFVDDVDTNTLVVTGATPAQLRTIDELILLWDVPEPVNKRRTRFSQLVAVRHGSSATIVETVKEAYRDLLSSNDKAFERRGGQGQSGGQEDKPEKSRRGRGSGMASGEEDGGDEDFSFTGKLSLGIDPVGNTILVSAEGEALLSLVVDMIGQLDQAAMPADDIEVVKLQSLLQMGPVGQMLQSRPAAAKKSPAPPTE